MQGAEATQPGREERESPVMMVLGKRRRKLAKKLKGITEIARRHELEKRGKLADELPVNEDQLRRLDDLASTEARLEELDELIDAVGKVEAKAATGDENEQGPASGDEVVAARLREAEERAEAASAKAESLVARLVGAEADAKEAQAQVARMSAEMEQLKKGAAAPGPAAVSASTTSVHKLLQLQHVADMFCPAFNDVNALSAAVMAKNRTGSLIQTEQDLHDVVIAVQSFRQRMLLAPVVGEDVLAWMQKYEDGDSDIAIGKLSFSDLAARIADLSKLIGDAYAAPPRQFFQQPPQEPQHQPPQQQQQQPQHQQQQQQLQQQQQQQLQQQQQQHLQQLQHLQHLQHLQDPHFMQNLSMMPAGDVAQQPMPAQHSMHQQAPIPFTSQVPVAAPALSPYGVAASKESAPPGSGPAPEWNDNGGIDNDDFETTDAAESTPAAAPQQSEGRRSRGGRGRTRNERPSGRRGGQGLPKAQPQEAAAANRSGDRRPRKPRGGGGPAQGAGGGPGRS